LFILAICLSIFRSLTITANGLEGRPVILRSSLIVLSL